MSRASVEDVEDAYGVEPEVGGPLIVEAYAAETVEDERGSRGTVIGYFKTKGQAENAAHGRGYYGGMGRVVPARLICLPQALGWPEPLYYVLARNEHRPVRLSVDRIRSHAALKANARAKLEASLTAAEMAALGIKLD